jgi:hypothetical protein
MVSDVGLSREDHSAIHHNCNRDDVEMTCKIDLQIRLGGPMNLILTVKTKSEVMLPNKIKLSVITNEIFIQINKKRHNLLNLQKVPLICGSLTLVIFSVK